MKPSMAIAVFDFGTTHFYAYARKGDVADDGRRVSKHSALDGENDHFVRVIGYNEAIGIA